VASAPAVGATEPELLANERAFAFSVRALDPGTLEARFAIAPGYYLYRDKLTFTVEPAGLASAPVLPAGKIKDDEYFGRVETYWTQLVVRLVLDRPAPGERVTIGAQSQGCADGRVCYPPQIQKVTLTLPAAGAGGGAPVGAVTPRKSWFD
jgi:thiol:disulfide interchange protein DsbD